MRQFGAGKIFVGRHFHIPAFAFKHVDALAGPFGKRGIVGKAFETGRSRAPMRLEDQIEAEGLRRLDDAQSGAVKRFGHDRVGVNPFHRIRNDDAWHRSSCRSTGGDGAADQSRAQERTRGIVNEHESRGASGKRIEPGPDGCLACCAARNRRQELR
jgi:hypothetical protein